MAGMATKDLKPGNGSWSHKGTPVRSPAKVRSVRKDIFEMNAPRDPVGWMLDHPKGLSRVEGIERLGTKPLALQTQRLKCSSAAITVEDVGGQPKTAHALRRHVEHMRRDPPKLLIEESWRPTPNQPYPAL